MLPLLPFLHSLFTPYCVSFADKGLEIVLHVVNPLPLNEYGEDPQQAAHSVHSAYHNYNYRYG